MAAQHDSAFEPEEQVFADRLDALEDAAVDDPRDARRQPARIGALGRDALADERLEPSGRAVQTSRPPAWRQAARADSSSSNALKIASENVGYGWIVSSSTSIGTWARTASVSWPSHSPASGPTATAPTTTRSLGVGRELHEAGPARALVRREPSALDRVARRHEAVALDACRPSRPEGR